MMPLKIGKKLLPKHFTIDDINLDAMPFADDQVILTDIENYLQHRFCLMADEYRTIFIYL